MNNTKQRAIKLAGASDFSQVQGQGVSGRCIGEVYKTCAKLTWNGTILKSPQSLIARLSKYSIRQVKLAIEWLKKNGYLWVKHNYIKDHDGRPRRGISTMSLRKLFARFASKSSIGAENAPLLLVSIETGELSGGKYTIKGEHDDWMTEYSRLAT